MKIGCISVKKRCFQECFETMSDFQKPQKYGDNATARKNKMVQISHFSQLLHSSGFTRSKDNSLT